MYLTDEGNNQTLIEKRSLEVHSNLEPGLQNGTWNVFCGDVSSYLHHHNHDCSFLLNIFSRYYQDIGTIFPRAFCEAPAKMKERQLSGHGQTTGHCLDHNC